MNFVLIALLVVLLIVLVFSKKQKKAEIQVTCLNEKYQDLCEPLEKKVLSKKELKKKKKKLKEEKKKFKEQEKKVFVLSFKGDIKASQVTSLRKEVSAVLKIATKKDEVVLLLESPGGIAYAYGLASSQLKRIRDKGICLTVCVDKIAASGGYMMACLGTKIISAPFAILGSIGVIGSLPNFHRFLKKHDIDYYELTAGKYKRNITSFGEVTDEKKQKALEDLSQMHQLFKEHVKTFRPSLDEDKVTQGDYWYGKTALKLKLVDELQTSDDYLSALMEKGILVYELKIPLKKKGLKDLLKKALKVADFIEFNQPHI